MSLYDGIDADDGVKNPPLPIAGINLSFLKDQLKAKKAALQPKATPAPSTSTAMPPAAPLQQIANSTEGPIEAPAATSSRSSRFSAYKPPAPIINLRPRKAVPLPLDATATFSIVPQALKEDKIFLFGEIEIRDEYNPTAPTDYAVYKQKREARLAKEKAAKDVAHRLAKQHAEEEKKRKVGAAIAPPPMLIEHDVKPAAPPPVFEAPAQFGKAGSRGLGVAQAIMSKMGYSEGKGLGRAEQGMSTALRMEKTGGNAGRIIGEDLPSSETGELEKSSAPNIGPAPSIMELMKNASKIVLLTNMVSPNEIDSELKDEIREEMTKYGQLNSVVIHKMQAPTNDEDAVRVFLEFTNNAQAIKAVIDLNQRFFGGRALKATFYSPDDLAAARYEV